MAEVALVVKNTKGKEAGLIRIKDGVVFWESYNRNKRGTWECNVDDFIEFLETGWNDYAKLLKDEYKP